MDKQVTRVGTVTVPDPAAAQTVTIGFRPRYVRAFSVNNLVTYEFYTGMTADTSLNIANHADTQIAVNAAGGITLNSNGFTLGTDICDTAGDVVHWIALR